MLADKLKKPLLSLRLSLALVMWLWVADKFFNPDHTSRVWSYFYAVQDFPHLGSYIIGVVQGLVVLAFTIGFKKRLSTGLLFLMHAGSTLSPMMLYLTDPFGKILFFPAWVMLAAFYVLYVMRTEDTLLSVD